MEKKITKETEINRIIELIKQAQQGNKEAMNQLIAIYKPYIDSELRFIRTTKEDALQNMLLEFLVFINDIELS